MNSRLDQHGDELEQRLLQCGSNWPAERSIVDSVMERIDESENARVSIWHGGDLTMRQRLTIGGLSVATLAVALVVLTLPATSNNLFAQVAENIKNATSYSLTMTMEMPKLPGDVKIPGIKQQTYWKAPGSYRFEDQEQTQDGPQKQVRIVHLDKPGIVLLPEKKTYRTAPAMAGSQPMMWISKLGEYEGVAEKKLPAKEVSGRQANGFQIGMREIDPDAHEGTAEIWIDTETRLPLLIRWEIKAAGGANIRMDNFVWNQPLDDRLFDSTPPDGFNDETPAPPAIDKQLPAIKTAFKKYAELSGGHYPRGKMIYGDVVMSEMKEMAGFKPTTLLMTQELADLLLAAEGFSDVYVILRDNADAVYSGKTVGPNDADKILLRWQLEDGTYQVIFGDLKDKRLTPEELGELTERSESN